MKNIFLITLIAYQQIVSAQFNIGLSIITIDAQTHSGIGGLYTIEGGPAIPSIQIREGSLNLKINGIIDRQATPQLTFSVMAEQIIGNELMIFALQDSNFVQYKAEGTGMGNYSGFYKDGWFHVFLRFKITASGHSSYLLDIPVYVHISSEGSVTNDNFFIEGVAHAYHANKASKKEKNKNSKEIIVRE